MSFRRRGEVVAGVALVKVPLTTLPTIAWPAALTISPITRPALSRCTSIFAPGVRENKCSPGMVDVTRLELGLPYVNSVMLSIYKSDLAPGSDHR